LVFSIQALRPESPDRLCLCVDREHSPTAEKELGRALTGSTAEVDGGRLADPLVVESVERVERRLARFRASRVVVTGRGVEFQRQRPPFDIGGGSATI